MPKDRYFGRYWASEEAASLNSKADIDFALAAFDRSKWKERVNKVLIEEENPDNRPEYDNDPPINRFR